MGVKIVETPKNKQFINITKYTFGRLSVESYAGERRWNCKCECGASKIVLGSSLRTGGARSCGCLKKELYTTHGKSSTPMYSVYRNMMTRCYNKGGTDYHNYGGRGIKVCDRWLESIENFIFDMGQKPTPSHSIDRIDSNGSYEPSNCRWATNRQQALNKRMRKDNTSGVTGVSWIRRDRIWQAHIRTGGKRINLGSFTNKQDAIEARKTAELIYHEEAQ